MTKTDIWTRDFIAIFAIDTLLAINHAALTVILARFAFDTFGAGTIASGFAVTAFVLGAVIAQTIAQRIKGRFRLRIVLLASLGLNFFISFLHLTIRDLPGFLILRLVHGLTFGLAIASWFSIALAATSLDTSTTQDHRSSANLGQLFFLGHLFSWAIGSVLALTFSMDGDYRPAIIAAALFIAIAIGAAILLSSDIDKSSDKSTEVFLTQDIENSFALMALSCLLNFSAILVFLPLYAHELGFAQSAPGYFVLLAVAESIGYLFEPMLVRSFAHKLHYAVVFLIALSTLILSFANFSVVLLIALLFIGISMGIIHALLFQTPTHTNTKRTAGIRSKNLYVIAFACGPLLFGVLKALIGWSATYIVLALLMLGSLAYYHVSYQQRKPLVPASRPASPRRRHSNRQPSERP